MNQIGQNASEFIEKGHNNGAVHKKNGQNNDSENAKNVVNNIQNNDVD